MVQKKFSKDPKLKLVSLEDFLEHSDYLSDAKKHLWKEGKNQIVVFIIRLHQDYLY